MLFFKARFLPLIRDGRKRQTVRLWTRPRVKVAQHAYVPGLGRVTITRVDKLRSLAALTAADAQADGFATRAALLAEIRKLYVGVKGARSVYRVRFEWNEPAANAKPASPPAPKPARKKSLSAKEQRLQLRGFVIRMGARVKMPP